MAKRRKPDKRRAKAKAPQSWFQKLSSFFTKIFEAPSQRAAKVRKNKAIREIKAHGYSPSYEKRLLRAVERGNMPTLQATRGHKPGEATRRREREKEAQGVTSSQIRSIKNFFARWDTHQKSLDPNCPDEAEMIEHAQNNGYERFVEYREQWNLMRRKYVRELKDGTWASRGLDYLTLGNEIAKAPSIEWLYYH